MKIVVCFGTRPEIIKLSPLVELLIKDGFDVHTIFTGQHTTLYNDVSHLIPNIHSKIIVNNEHIVDLYSDVCIKLRKEFQSIKPDLVIVQGDTASAYASAFCAFLMGIKIGHVEAGLRTYDISSPFPEEFNRQMISKVAHYNWCPSEIAVRNLENEGAKGLILNTGNTIVDFVKAKVKSEQIEFGNNIVVTLHRRENKDVFSRILAQIDMLAEKHGLQFIFPVHPNPIIQKHIGSIKSNNFAVVPPYKYEDFIDLLAKCRGIITDSGGIQEEAVCLGKRVLVCRNNTERMEGVEVGIAKLVGENVADNFDWVLEKPQMNFRNPYGEGDSSRKIIESIC